MAMMENLQTQNDTALPQWVSWNKSFSMTGCFGSRQIKLSYSRQLKLRKWTNILGAKWDHYTFFFFFFFSCHVWFVETFSGGKARLSRGIIDVLMILLEWNKEIGGPSALFKWLSLEFAVTCYCNSSYCSPHTLATAGLWSLIPNFMLCFCTNTHADG